MDICFLISTYNRQESCQRLVDGLQGLGHIVVVNDGSDYVINGCEQYIHRPHMGRSGYFVIVNLLWSHRGRYKYYMMLPDDFVICESQIKQAVELWEGISDPQKICLNLYADRIGCSCWTNFIPIEKETVWHTQWVDMCFLCEDRFFKEVPQISIPFVYRGFGRSSGVGAYISRRLNKKKYNMYQVKESLVDIQEEHHNTQMQRMDNAGVHRRSRRWSSQV